MSFYEDQSLLGFVDTQPAPLVSDLSDDVPGRMQIRLANSMWHEDGVNALLERKYTARGYNAPCVNVLSRDTRTVTLFAVSTSDKIVGTITLRLDGPSGLDCERAFKAEVAPFRAAGERLCEFVSFGVDLGTDARASMYVRGALVHVAYIFARLQNHAQRAFIEVNPRHVDFYVQAMGFARACPGADVRPGQRARGAA